MHLWDRGHPGVVGGICVQWPRIRKIRTEALNLQPQLIILYMVATVLELSKITGPKNCLHYNSTLSTLSKPKIQSNVIEVNENRKKPVTWILVWVTISNSILTLFPF